MAGRVKLHCIEPRRADWTNSILVGRRWYSICPLVQMPSFDPAELIKEQHCHTPSSQIILWTSVLKPWGWADSALAEKKKLLCIISRSKLMQTVFRKPRCSCSRRRCRIHNFPLLLWRCCLCLTTKTAKIERYFFWRDFTNAISFFPCQCTFRTFGMRQKDQHCSPSWFLRWNPRRPVLCRRLVWPRPLGQW